VAFISSERSVRGIAPAVAASNDALPLLLMMMLADHRRVRESVGGALEGRIAEAVTAASRGHIEALRQCLEAALQHVGRHVPAAVLARFEPMCE
jgi:hypothetical protein